MKTKLAAWIVLGVIAVFAAACLGATNEITKDVIAEQTARAAEEARRGLVTEAETFEELALAEDSGADYCYEGRAADGTPVGYVAQVTVQGYGGPVEVIVGTDAEGVLTGIEVGGASFAETAGLGAKAKEEAFTGQFVGKTTPLALGDGENDIDAITAATITSNAVLRAVNTAVEEIGGFAGFEIASTASGGEIGEGRYAASVNGFAGPVYVEIQLDENNVITEIVIGDDQFAETAGYGEQAKEPAFYEQFLGKTGQLTLGTDIDAISGATITSQAVVDAVNMAMLYATDPEAAAAANAPQEFVLPDVPEGALTSSASSKGFGGPVEASITVDTDGTTLLRVEFGGEKWAETDGIGTRILEDAFWQQFIGKTLPLAEGDVDVIAGATVSSEAAINAVNKAYYKLFPEAEPAKEETVEASAEEAPAEETGAPASGTAEASSKGYGGPVAASITVEDGVLTAVTFGSDSFAETEGLGTKVLEEDFAAQFIGKALPLAEGDVDVIAGATVSSEAAISAVNKAYEKLLGQ